MPFMTDQELMKNIKQGSFAKVYMLFGKEKYMLEGCLKLLLERVVTVQRTFNFTGFDGAKCSIEDIENAIEILPLLADRRCVSVSDLNIEKLGKAQYDRLKSMVDNLPDTTVLVFSFANIDVNLKKVARYKAFSALMAKTGVVVEFATKSQSDLAKILIKRAGKQRVIISQHTCIRLIERCGTTLNRLLVELDKLMAYVGTGENIPTEIFPEHVEMLVVRNMESSAFDLAKAILQGRDQQAFSLLGELFHQRQEEIAILGALSMSFIDIYRAKCAQSAGENETAITRAYNYKGKEFRMRNSMRDASRFSLAHIKHCLNALMEADVKLKSSRTDNRVLLETAIAQMMMANVQ